MRGAPFNLLFKKSEVDLGCITTMQILFAEGLDRAWFGFGGYVLIARFGFHTEDAFTFFEAFPGID